MYVYTDPRAIPALYPLRTNIWPPPTPPPFPYTTLFRSPALGVVTGIPSRRKDSGPLQFQSLDRRGPESLRREGMPDRKSTRLNSSHVEISYAVFCLKKKKKSCRT